MNIESKRIWVWRGFTPTYIYIYSSSNTDNFTLSINITFIIMQQLRWGFFLQFSSIVITYKTQYQYSFSENIINKFFLSKTHWLLKAELFIKGNVINFELFSFYIFPSHFWNWKVLSSFPLQWKKIAIQYKEIDHQQPC